MTFIPFTIIFLTIVLRIQKGPFQSILFFIATKSIVDIFWFIRIGPLSFVSAQGILFPLLLYPFIIKKNNIPEFWTRIRNLYVFSLILGSIWGLTHNALMVIETIIITVNIFLAFFIFPMIIESRNHLRYFLIAIIVSGVFPVIITVLQYQTGFIVSERSTVGLIRYVGFYHDSFPVRFYSLITILAIMIYKSFFSVKMKLISLLMNILLFSCFISIYLVFSKAAIIILCLWGITMIVFSKFRFRQFFVFIFGILFILLFFGESSLLSIEQLFSKEIGYQIGEYDDIRFTLAGRGYIWEEYWNNWVDQNLIVKLIGSGITRPTHNEYLRLLILNGVLGLLLFILALSRIFILTFRVDENLRAFAFMFIFMYAVDTIGLTPGVYYYYNIILWSFLSLFVLKPSLFLRNDA